MCENDRIYVMRKSEDHIKLETLYHCITLAVTATRKHTSQRGREESGMAKQGIVRPRQGGDKGPTTRNRPGLGPGQSPHKAEKKGSRQPAHGAAKQDTQTRTRPGQGWVGTRRTQGRMRTRGGHRDIKRTARARRGQQETKPAH